MSDSSLPEAGARLTLDLSEWESNWSQVIGDADTLQSTIDDLSGSVDIDINMDVPDTGDLDAITELDGESIDTEIDATQSEDSKSIVDNLNFLATLEKIKLIIDIAGNVWDFASQVGDNLVNPFLDVEQAVARVTAQTGGTGMKDLGQFIRDIQAADLGESVAQITDVVIQARQLDLPIQDATESALTFTHTWQDVDPTTVVGAWGTALQTGIVDNMQEASDLMTVFFQQGGNIGGDAIQVVQANAQSWADMNLSMADALSLMNSLQSGTGATATDAAKMMQTFDDQFTAAAADPSSQQAKLLKMIGIDNPKEAGEAIGADTFNAFADAFSTQSSETQDLISGMFFGKGGKKFTGAIGEMTTEGGPFADVVGAAEDAATAIDDHLRGAIDDFVLEINTKIVELLASDSIDLPGKIEALKKGFQEAVDVLASGGTFGEAIEVGLKIEGFAEGVDRFEASVGGFAISVLEIIAGIQDFLGKDSSTTRAQIASMEKNQLPFNLKVANADEVSTEINTAIGRGLSTDDILKAAGTAVDELVSSGNADNLQKAQALVDSLKTVGGDVFKAAPGLNSLEQATADWALQRGGDLLQSAIEGGIVVPVSIDTSGLQAEIDAKITELNTHFGPNEGRGVAYNPFQNLGNILPSGGTASGGLLGSLTTDAQTAIETLDTATATATTNMGTNFDNLNVNLTDNTAAVIANLDATTAKVTELDTVTAERLTENTVTASFEAVEETASRTFPAVVRWMETAQAAAAQMDIVISGHVQHLLNILHDLQFLSAQVATGVQQAIALGNQLPGGSSVTNNNTSVTVNNNVQSNAQASANGYAIASSLRPGGA